MIMAKGNNSQGKEGKKPKKGAEPKGGDKKSPPKKPKK